jgi:hypothetical protein
LIRAHWKAIVQTKKDRFLTFMNQGQVCVNGQFNDRISEHAGALSASHGGAAAYDEGESLCME